MWQTGIVDSSYDAEQLKAKGDEIQKLSVIETLPQLLAEDAHSCITRVLPKIQQSLPTASTEFHMAAAVIFKQILVQKLVSYTIFSEVFLHSILSSLENREPVISHAWLETILEVIEILPTDIIKREILPLAISAGNITQSISSRIMCCRLLGKISTRFDAATVNKEILPTVQSLCQDVSGEVRANISLQLRFVAEKLGDNILKLLPYLVELINDEESSVRQASIQTIGYFLPLLKSADAIKDILIPLIKVSCDSAMKTENNVICVAAKEFGKLAQYSEPYLTPNDKSWFIKFYINMGQLGTTNIEDSKKDFFISGNAVRMNERSVECRRNCAYNLPAMLLFASTTPDGVNILFPTFQNLANDSYFMVRRTIACCLHEIVKVLGSKNALVKPELVKLLKDEHEEVLQGLIPNLRVILENLIPNKAAGMDQMDSSALDIGRALIKCEAEISYSHNWRLSASLLNQFEILPKCFPSDFIYTYLVPVINNRVLYSRPLPVRLAAGRTLLVFLRYNLKLQQRVEIRNQICNHIGHNSSCYTRMIFVRMMIEATTMYSTTYFKEHFCLTLLNMIEDPVANIRIKVLSLTPTIKRSFKLPGDKKLLAILESNIRSLMGDEKDKDVKTALYTAVHDLERIECRTDNQSPKNSKFEIDDAKKYEEEKKLEAMAISKAGPQTSAGPRKSGGKPPPNIRKSTGGPSTNPSTPTPKEDKAGASRRVSSIVTSRQSSAPAPRHSEDYNKASTSSDNITPTWSRYTSKDSSQLTQSLEKASASHNSNLTSTNPSYNTSSNDYSSQKVKCSCYELADRLFRAQNFSSSAFSPEQPHHSDSTHCSCLNSFNHLKTTNLFRTKHDYKLPDFSKSTLLTSTRDDKHDIWQDFVSARPSFSTKYKIAELNGYHSHYNPYWTFSSMPEIPVTLVDDEFLVDTGIRIPSQLTSSQSTSKIPNLQDIIYRNKKVPNTDRPPRRSNTNFEKSKPHGFTLMKSYSLDYDDGIKQPQTSSSSSGHSSSNHDSQYTSGSSDRTSVADIISPSGRSRFGFELARRKPLDEKSKRSSDLMGKDHQSQNVFDKSKRQSNSSMSKPPVSSKESSKLKFNKRHSVEVADYDPNDSSRRALRGLSILDVNHNQGSSKIPVRNIHISESKTAPVTRTSSPIRLDSELFEKLSFNQSKSFSQDRCLRRFRSTDEDEIYKICQKF